MMAVFQENYRQHNKVKKFVFNLTELQCDSNSKKWELNIYLLLIMLFIFVGLFLKFIDLGLSLHLCHISYQ